MTSMTTYDDDLRAIALAYIERREDGALVYPAFLAAVDAYRKRHPETDNGEAALTVSNLLQEIPRAGPACPFAVGSSAVVVKRL